MAAQLQEQYQDYARALAFKLYKSLNIAVDLDDVLADANLGLVEAAANYDPSAGASFETFAYYRIRGAIFDGIRKATWLPPAARASAAALEGTNDVLARNAQEIQSSQDPEELTKQFNEAVRLLGAVFTVSQLGRQGDDESEAALDTEDVREAAVGASLERSEVMERVKAAIKGLPEEQRALIERIYFEQTAMSEVAREMGVNKSTVSRHHQRAIKGLRAILLSTADP